MSVGEPSSFQVTLTAPLEGAIQSLTFSSLQLYWDEHKSPIVVQHATDKVVENYSRIDVGSLESSIASDTEEIPFTPVHANLTWTSGHSKVITGHISSLVPKELKASVTYSYFNDRYSTSTMLFFLDIESHIDSYRGQLDLGDPFEHFARLGNITKLEMDEFNWTSCPVYSCVP